MADRFANNNSFNDLVLVKAQTIAQDARDDQELREWWSRVGTYLRRLLVESGYIVEPKSGSDGRKLLDDGKKFYGSGSDGDLSTPEIAPVIAPANDITTANGTPSAASAAAAGIPAASITEDQSVSAADSSQRGKYRQHLDTLFDGLGEYVKGISQDEGNRK